MGIYSHKLVWHSAGVPGDPEAHAKRLKDERKEDRQLLDYDLPGVNFLVSRQLLFRVEAARDSGMYSSEVRLGPTTANGFFKIWRLVRLVGSLWRHEFYSGLAIQFISLEKYNSAAALKPIPNAIAPTVGEDVNISMGA